MGQLFVCNPGLKSALAALTGATGPWNAALIALGTATSPLDETAGIADLQEPTFGGYARSIAVVWGTEYVDTHGNAYQITDTKQFAPTDSTASSTITCVGLVDKTGATLLAVYNLDTPIVMGTPNDVHNFAFWAGVAQPSGLAAPDIIP